MATASTTYEFTNGTTADGTQVQQNFNDLVTFLNNSVVHLDGSKTMTGILTLPASNPTTANQATRKAYVDSLVGSDWTAYTPTLGGSGTSIGNGSIVGAYRRVGVNTLFVRAVLTAGSSTDLGSGFCYLSMPSDLSVAADSVQQMVPGFFKDNSGNKTYPCIAIATAGNSTIGPFKLTNPVSNVNDTTPVSVGSGDTLGFSGVLDVDLEAGDVGGLGE